MKKIMTFLGVVLFVSFIMTSCGGDSSSSTNDETELGVTKGEGDTLTSGSGDVNGCYQLLKDYENFVDEYIVVMKKFNDNPSDESVLSEFISMEENAALWADKFTECTEGNIDFALKISAIGQKLPDSMD